MTKHVGLAVHHSQYDIEAAAPALVTYLLLTLRFDLHYNFEQEHDYPYLVALTPPGLTDASVEVVVSVHNGCCLCWN